MKVRIMFLTLTEVRARKFLLSKQVHRKQKRLKKAPTKVSSSVTENTGIQGI